MGIDDYFYIGPEPLLAAANHAAFANSIKEALIKHHRRHIEDKILLSYLLLKKR